MSDKPVYKPIELGDMNSVAGLLISLKDDTLGYMLQDIKTMLENPKCPEFQYETLAEWGGYIAQELIARSGLTPEQLADLKKKYQETCGCEECRRPTGEGEKDEDRCNCQECEGCDEEPGADSILTDEGEVLPKDKLN
jgi:hypothetical protein